MWLLADHIRVQIEHAQAAGMVINTASSFSPEKVGVVGNKMIIPIDGILTQKPNLLAAFFGGGNFLYSDLITTIAAANEDPLVESIELIVGDSPGGEVVGLIQAMDAIRDSKKPVDAVVNYAALSATYGLVSQARTIIADSRATQLGSIGIAYDTTMREDEIHLTNSESPNKRPDLTTDAGRQVVRAQLDEMYNLFAKAIATGRKTTLRGVDEKFGKGAIVLAEQALKAGMIDSIKANDALDKPTAKAANRERSQMDLNQLKAEHPDVYAAAVALGQKSERDRVCAHLTLGKTSGDMETALKAIADGAEMTATLTATYLAAGMKQAAINARAADNQNLAIEPETADRNSFSAQIAKQLSARTEEEGLING